jgi:hypothetical protein
MSQQPYPASWPQPTGINRNLLVNKVTEQQKLDLYNRVITTRDLAKLLEVSEEYISTLFPGKVPANGLRNRATRRREFVKVRKAFRLEQAKLVLAGKLTAAKAAEQSFTSYRTIARLVQHVKSQA